MKYFTTQRKFYSTKGQKELINKIHKYNINTVTMGFPDLYGRFMGKKYDSDFFVQKVLKSGSNACNYLLSCDMAFDPIPNTKIASYDIGFGDFTMQPDLNSFREINYIGDHKQILLFSNLFDENKPITHSPRYMLTKILEELSEMNIHVKAQCDINFMIFQEKYKKIEDNVHTASPITDHPNLYNTLYKQNKDSLLNKFKQSLKTSNILTEQISGAGTPGQYSISLSLTDPLEFCDNVTLLKLCMKKIADDEEKSITFMAKPYSNYQGNSANIKLVFTDKNGNNLFNNSDKLNFSNVGEKVVAGIMNHILDFFIFYSPTVNSYKRLRETYLDQNWNKIGYMQDDMGLNLIAENNIEKLLFKLPGSDTNFYLSLFGLLSSVKLGIKNNYSLEKVISENINKRKPFNLNNAKQHLDNNCLMKELLGDIIHQHFVAFYNYEYTNYMNQIDDWELNRYLLNI